MGRVLVVEDDYDTRESLRLLLRDEGFEVTTASNGEEALKILSTTTFCLILLDFKMPKMNGFNFADALSRLPAHASTPVVLLTSDERFQDARKKFLMKIDRIVMKPVPPNIADVVRHYCPC